MPTPTVLLTGATGFVGEQLLAALRPTQPLRVVVRDAARLADPAGLDVVEGDVGDPRTLDRALGGGTVELAYYLVHSMEPGVGGGFADRDRALAEAFVAAAGRHGVRRIAYLGGIAAAGDASRSEHLESRQEVERILGGGAPELVALRASMIVGARSDSFRTLAQIVDRLPVLALPSWRTTRTQPVAVADVVAALAAAGRVAPGGYDVAGPDTLTVEGIVARLGSLLGAAKPTFPLPVSSSRLEGAAAALVTDSDREVLEPLMAGLHEDLVVEDNALEPVFGVRPTPFDEAARDALAELAAA